MAVVPRQVLVLLPLPVSGCRPEVFSVCVPSGHPGLGVCRQYYSSNAQQNWVSVSIRKGVREPFESEQLPVEIIGERLGPLGPLDVAVLIQYYLKRFSVSDFLVSGCLINERNNPDSGKSPDEKLALLCYVCVLRLKNTSLFRQENSVANVCQHNSLITVCQ